MPNGYHARQYGQRGAPPWEYITAASVSSAWHFRQGVPGMFLFLGLAAAHVPEKWKPVSRKRLCALQESGEPAVSLARQCLAGPESFRQVPKDCSKVGQAFRTDRPHNRLSGASRGTQVGLI